MKVNLSYGKTGLTAEIPDKNVVNVLKMKPVQPFADPQIEVIKALESPIGTAPLEELASGKKSAVIAICDITRPMPNALLLPLMCEKLENGGIPRENILILVATGIHRPNLGDELKEIVGEYVYENYRIENHYSQKPENHTYLGKTSIDVPVYIDTFYMEADLKITTGYIEPHLMAGYSAGRKLVCPGVASLDTVRILHSPRIMENKNCREGIVDGNPFHQQATEIARMAGVDFIVNLSMNEEKKITGIFAGDMEEAHAKGIEFVKGQVLDTVPEQVDVVVTTSAGYPLDQTLYQAIKGYSAAKSIVKPGGTVILAAKCNLGLGSREFAELFLKTESIGRFMEDIMKPDYFVVDQWMMEHLGQVMRKANCFLHSDQVKPEDKNENLITYIDSVEEGIEKALQKYGEDAKIAVIPKGPYVLARTER